jgi:uncharacterized protein
LKRLRKWQDYLTGLTSNQSSSIIATAITLALWFEGSSEAALGIYTSNVDRYLNEARPQKYWHEDVIFCGRRRIEYHLNMVGAEIMNRAFRKDFIKTDRKLLLIPTCMRLLGDTKCKSENIDNWLKCVECTKECQVCYLSEMGRKNRFDVFMVAHESSISAGKNKKMQLDSNTGVIGVSCILNLISGGWMLKEMGIPAQCVLLDYCGCKNHWHEQGIPTSINVQKLNQIMKA